MGSENIRPGNAPRKIHSNVALVESQVSFGDYVHSKVVRNCGGTDCTLGHLAWQQSKRQIGLCFFKNAVKLWYYSRTGPKCFHLSEVRLLLHESLPY